MAPAKMGPVGHGASSNGSANGAAYDVIETTPGRIIFNTALPDDFEFVNDVIGKKAHSIGKIVEVLASDYPRVTVADSLDKIKELCYRYATQSGLTISMEDVKVPAAKKEIVDRHEADAEKAESQFKRGIITDDERRQKEIEIWTTANSEVGKAMEEALHRIPFNPLDMMVDSGARGNPQQVRQIAGMKGLVSNPRGEMIPRPIVSSFREGLSVLEYFISTHGARKGLADTALRTADSGYLTRRLVDVAQELIVREDDCGSTRGIWVRNVRPDDEKARYYLETRLDGRVLVRDVTLSDGTRVPGRYRCTCRDHGGSCATTPPVNEVMVRSVLTCESNQGICASCYGRSLAADQHIELGEAVGVIAAQSIGEPGTQLTMRTFHTGGIAGEDITHGLPRVVELFEARTPKGAAVLARTSGVVRITEEDNSRRVAIVGDDGSEDVYTVALGPSWPRASGTASRWRLATPSSKARSDPKALLEIKGIRETQQYLVEEVQQVYRDQGVSIHDKHIELIVRQMLRRVLVAEQGESPFLPGERVDSRFFAEVNRELVQQGKRPAEGPPRAHGHHQGVAGHRQLAFGRLLPGDDQGPHGGRHRRQVRPALRAEGKHHHREADPGRYGHAPLPRRGRRRARGAAHDLLDLRRGARHRGPGRLVGQHREQHGHRGRHHLRPGRLRRLLRLRRQLRPGEHLRERRRGDPGLEQERATFARLE